MKKRIYYIDNIKVILILLVVFGHYIEPFIHDNEYMMMVYKLIYSFHMPLFAFASGFFVKPYNKFGDIKKPLLQYITFSAVYGILILVTSYLRPENMTYFTSQVTESTMVDNMMLVLTPIWILWYLVALIIWRGLITFIPKNKYIIPITFVVALLFGLVTVTDGALALQRVFCFFPFYYLGYYLDITKLEIIKKRLWPLSLSLIVTIPLFMYLTQNINFEWWYFSDGYNQLNETIFNGATIRLINILWALYMCIMVICIIPSKETFYTKLGSQTLYIYIGHGILMVFILLFGLFSFSVSILSIIFLVIFVFISAYVLTKKPISTIIDILSWSKL